MNFHLDTDFGGDPDDFAALLMLLGMAAVSSGFDLWLVVGHGAAAALLLAAMATLLRR